MGVEGYEWQPSRNETKWPSTDSIAAGIGALQVPTSLTTRTKERRVGEGIFPGDTFVAFPAIEIKPNVGFQRKKG